jgi:hypothetical protein
MKYKVRRFNLSMTRDEDKLESFLNNLEGEVASMIPNIAPFPFVHVDSLLIVEKVK